MLASSTTVLSRLAPLQGRGSSTAACTKLSTWKGRFLKPVSTRTPNPSLFCKYNSFSSVSRKFGAGNALSRPIIHLRKLSTSNSNSEPDAAPEDKKLTRSPSKTSNVFGSRKEDYMKDKETLEKLKKEDERLFGRNTSYEADNAESTDSTSTHESYNPDEEVVRESRVKDSSNTTRKSYERKSENTAQKEGGPSQDSVDPLTSSKETPETGDQPTESEGTTIGRIGLKRITREQAEALGIKTGPSSFGREGYVHKSLWEDPLTRKRREEGEKASKAKSGNQRPKLNFKLDDLVSLSKKYWFWLALAAVSVLPPLLATYSNWDRDAPLVDPAIKFEPQWKREEYIALSDTRVEGVIFEMCGVAALAALPGFNPITSPLTAIRGDISPVFPSDRQGTGPPTFWKLRIDFPGPRQTEWERNDSRATRVQPASPTFRGAQFMWILSRTWENGEPVIRILLGRQVGGTTKANPKKSLIPWRKPAFRPRRLNSLIRRHTEYDLMFKQLFFDQTQIYQAAQIVGLGIPEQLEKNRVTYDLEEYEYDLLEQKGFGDYLYYPDSVPWPSDQIIVDPLGVLLENSNDPELALAWEDSEFAPAQMFDQDDQYEYDLRYDLPQEVPPEYLEQNSTSYEDYDDYDDYDDYEDYDETENQNRR